MEAKLLFLSENGKKSQGEDICSYTFKLNPPLNLSEPGEFHCAMTYLHFRQLHIDFEDEVYLELGDTMSDGDIQWSGVKHELVLLDTKITSLLQKISVWQGGIKDFDGKLDVGVAKVEGEDLYEPYAKMYTKNKCVRISSNLQRLLGFYSNEFASENVQGEESVITPGWTRWMQGPLLLDLDILEERGLDQYGAETQLPDGNSSGSTRSTYLALVPLRQDGEMQVDNVSIEIRPQGDQLRWVRTRQSMLTHVTLSMRWPNGEAVFVDSIFRLACEIVLKRRKMLTFV